MIHTHTIYTKFVGFINDEINFHRDIKTPFLVRIACWICRVNIPKYVVLNELYLIQKWMEDRRRYLRVYGNEL